MGRLFVIIRLAARDLRHRPGPAILLLIAITAATTTLTLGLALRGVSDQPYQQTRAATSGPDIVAAASTAAPLDRLTRADGVTAHSGPYPYTYVTLTANGRTAGAQVQGRDQAAAAVDQPKPTQGGWVRPGQVVLERSFATELGVSAGDTVRLDGARSGWPGSRSPRRPRCSIRTSATRRVGLLKAVGSSPGLIAAILLAEHLAVALTAAALGLLAGGTPAHRPGRGPAGRPGHTSH